VWAQNQQPADRDGDTALDFWIAGGDTSDRRKGVEEVSQPPRQSRPGTFLCGPSDPLCQ
jgi:hypothetical protein